jgi:hypothetical protein
MIERVEKMNALTLAVLRSHLLTELVQPNEIVVSEMQSTRRLQVFKLLAESVGQPGKAPHAHPHGQVLTLDHAGRDKALSPVARVRPRSQSRTPQVDFCSGKLMHLCSGVDKHLPQE